METLEKLVTVAFFAALLYWLIGEMMQYLIGQLDTAGIAPTIRYYLCALGIFEAVNIFVSLLIASWFTNKIISYLAG